jgi:hypothetical protein
MKSTNGSQFREKLILRHRAIVLCVAVLFGAIIAVNYPPKAMAVPCKGQDCTKSAACPGDCYQFSAFGSKCSKTIAHPNPGKVCEKADDKTKTCDNDKNVKCGKSGYKSCNASAPPDCSGVSYDTDISVAGCGT